ncbi:MAG TPA: hypothetical protein VLA36_01450 [Longimicrobiales bacterium]|nr:hypothetical protein [Longimicrobiales bacterium]
MLRLDLFGATDITSAEGSAAHSVLRQPKRLAVLAYLVLARPRGLHRRDHLVAIFWPDKDEDHARGALSQALSFLRRSLGEDVIRSRGDDVGVDTAMAPLREATHAPAWWPQRSLLQSAGNPFCNQPTVHLQLDAH